MSAKRWLLVVVALSQVVSACKAPGRDEPQGFEIVSATSAASDTRGERVEPRVPPSFRGL